MLDLSFKLDLFQKNLELLSIQANATLNVDMAFKGHPDGEVCTTSSQNCCSWVFCLIPRQSQILINCDFLHKNALSLIMKFTGFQISHLLAKQTISFFSGIVETLLQA